MFLGLQGEPKFHHFIKHDVNSISGRRKFRRLGSPNKAMKALQQRFCKWFLRSVEYAGKQRVWLTHATACRFGNRTLYNVLPHRKNRFFYLLDFHDAFGSVDPKRLAAVLVEMEPDLANKTEELRAFLENNFFAGKDGLVQGGNASGDLFNLYVGCLIDAHLKDILAENAITYTRYLDDLTFSSARHITRETRRKIRSIATQAGFSFSWRKCEYLDLQKRQTVMITGIGLEYGGRIFVPRRFLRKAKAIFHAAAKPESEIPLCMVEGLASPLRNSIPGDQKRNRIESKLLTQYLKAKEAADWRQR